MKTLPRLLATIAFFFMASLVVVFSETTLASALHADRSERKNTDSYIYTNSNVLGENSIVGFKVSNNGTLTELRGSPFPTGGSGTGGVVFSQNGIVASKNGRLLFTANAGTNTLAVMRIAENGNLTPVPGSPFPTGGVTPVSLALDGDLLYVAHIGTSFDQCRDCNIRGFRVHASGILESIPGAGVTFDDSPPRLPFAIGFNPGGDALIGTRFPASPIPAETSTIDTFQVDRKTGVLTRSPGSPFVSQHPQPAGFGFNPANDTQLFISNVVAINQLPGSVSTYLFASTGQIAPLPGSPFSSEQFSTCWVALTSNGKYLYATNPNSDSITSFKVSREGSLELVKIIPVPNIDNVEDMPLEIIVSPDDAYVYTVNGQVGGVVGFKIVVGGDLQLLPNQPFALSAKAKPFGLAYVRPGSGDNSNRDKKEDSSFSFKNAEH